jgi:hypothetical protein
MPKVIRLGIGRNVVFGKGVKDGATLVVLVVSKIRCETSKSFVRRTDSGQSHFREKFALTLI